MTLNSLVEVAPGIRWQAEVHFVVLDQVSSDDAYYEHLARGNKRVRCMLRRYKASRP